jgi:L-ornithine N5-monooxygenase
VLDELYVLIYEQRIDGDQRVFVRGNRVATDLAEGADAVRLTTADVHTGGSETEDFDFVVLATGFRNLGPGPQQERYPPLLRDVIDHFRFEPDGSLAVTRDYRLSPRLAQPELPPLFLNGLCETSHGIGDAGSFSLLSLRAETLGDALAAHTPATHHVPVSEEALL